MKKSLLIFSLVFISAALSAQVIVPKGTRIAGGNISIGNARNHFDTTLNGNDVNTYSNYNVNFNPTFGWAKKDNEVYGIMLHTTYQHWKQESNNTFSKGSFIAAGPGVFYERFFNLGKGFHFSANGSLYGTYGVTKNKSYTNSVLTNDAEGKRYDINFSVTPRIGYSINKKFMVQASIGELLNMNFSHTNWKSSIPGGSTSQHNYNIFNVNTGLNRGLSLSNIGFTFRYSF
jgi:hypothetical protein